jgi:WD40 repeat protein
MVKYSRRNKRGGMALQKDIPCPEISTLIGHEANVNSVAFHPTAPLIATISDDKTTKLWSFQPNGSRATCVDTLNSHRLALKSVSFNLTGTILATSSIDNTAKF